MQKINKCMKSILILIGRIKVLKPTLTHKFSQYVHNLL